MSRFVLTTFGSLGDLHPTIAIGLGLARRGHEAIVATSEAYRRPIESLGLGFRPLRPDWPAAEDEAAFVERFLEMRRGPKRLICEFMMPLVRQSFEDTLRAAAGADFLLAHPLTFGTRLVAEKTGIRWASSHLFPMSFFSVFDPPLVSVAPNLSRMRFLGPRFFRLALLWGKRHVRPWSEPWHRLRREIGLPPTADPLFDGAHSPRLILALFSPLLGRPQPDWPRQTVVTGFPLYDRSAAGMPAELSRFLDNGSPPVVFTLGSAAVLDAGRFFVDSVAAARALGRRAVLLTGRVEQHLPASLSSGVIACSYAPFSELFPRAAAVVHHGGIGTTTQALRAGRPMLVMPYSYDQPDNAARVTRLGVARVVSRRRYTAGRAAAELDRLLADPAYAARAAAIGARIRAEDGVAVACDALEAAAGA
ncbi:MAG TPA: nucleotide disphospho-sugar-binding domain-containing protein [Pirellulales bacterium]|nr:nucleotide disphospho-sugar-binding domain-containing protein [Pirellulales bacterium]